MNHWAACVYKIRATHPWLAGFFLFNFSGALFAQDLSKSVPVDGTNVTIVMTPMDHGCRQKARITLGEMFCVRVLAKVSDPLWLKDLRLERFDAVMPEHRHGMVTRARVREERKGEYLIEGVKLHMPGNWEFKLDLLHGKSTAQVAIPMKL